MQWTPPSFELVHNFQWDALLLFGGLVLLGLIAGQVVARTRWIPRLTGYILIGFLLGAGGLNLFSDDMLQVAGTFADIAVALVAYQLGRYVDIGWLGREKWLVATVLTCAILCFGLVSGALLWHGQSVVLAGLGGIMAMATAPAVIVVLVRDLNAEGKITRRLVTMTALNNAVALLALYALLPIISHEKNTPFVALLGHAIYSVGGALLLAFALYKIAIPLARLLGRAPSRQFALVVALITAAIGVAHALQLPVMLSMLMFAIMSKNLDRQFDLMELEFGVTSELFVIMLFITIGAAIRLSDLWAAAASVALLVVMRLVAMAVGIALFARPARMEWRQAGLLILGTLPMTEAGIGLMQNISSLYPQAAADIAPLLAGSMIVLELFGPISTQFALRISGESERAA